MPREGIRRTRGRSCTEPPFIPATAVVLGPKRPVASSVTGVASPEMCRTIRRVMTAGYNPVIQRDIIRKTWGQPGVVASLPPAGRLPRPSFVEAVVAMIFIPNRYVPLTEAVVEAFAIQHSDVILATGLQSHEAKQIATHWLARDRVKEVEFRGREGTRFARSGKKMTGIVPPQLTAKDREIAQETEELRPLAEKGVTLRPLLKTTWDDLRSRLSAGQMIGYLAEPSGKIHKIAAHEWNRDDADVAHITGWFSVAHAWGHVVGPVALLRPDIQQVRFPDAGVTKKSRAGRRRGSTDYDWEEGKMFAFKMLSEKGDFANPANRVDGGKTKPILRMR
jgi:hypothetical protein